MTTYARGKKWADAGVEVNERRRAQPEDRQFQLEAEFGMTGDQPAAVSRLTDGVEKGIPRQSLMGVTGSGKTFTMANVVQQVQKPTLVMAHNKTLAAQLASEFKEFFPHNAVEYFVSYYDYYQPEAYVPQSDTYIEKDSSVNEELDKLRLSATTSLLTRRDVLIVASVSCIYGLGDPQDYFNLVAQVKVGEIRNRSQLVRQLVDMQYDRNDLDLSRAKFRVRGDVLELVPAYEEAAVRIQFFGDEVERIVQLDPLTGEMLAELPQVAIYPANHFVTTKDKLDLAVEGIREELEWRLRELRDTGKILEAARLESRTNYDLEMLQETGFCSGVENYARHLSQRPAGSAPWTLLDYFPEDYLLFVDESHMTLPQVRGMYHGDISRKKTLVEFGFRLPSALDNRPLNFEEYESRINQVVYVSATPGPFELQHSRQVVEQVIRPTGLLDPTIEVLPTTGQIDDLLWRIKDRVQRAERVLVTTLTKRMAEELADYLSEMGIRNTYLHSDIETLDRIEILRDLRLGVYDVIVGINLLREGLDLPEVSMVAILDADKEGYLRSETSMIQTIGRAARHANGHVVMYADRMTDSMQKAIDETSRRRQLQTEHNQRHGIEPQSIQKEVHDITEGIKAIAENRARYNTVRKEMSRADMFKGGQGPGSADEGRRQIAPVREGGPVPRRDFRVAPSAGRGGKDTGSGWRLELASLLLQRPNVVDHVPDLLFRKLTAQGSHPRTGNAVSNETEQVGFRVQRYVNHQVCGWRVQRRPRRPVPPAPLAVAGLADLHVSCRPRLQRCRRRREGVQQYFVPSDTELGVEQQHQTGGGASHTGGHHPCAGAGEPSRPAATRSLRTESPRPVARLPAADYAVSGEGEIAALPAAPVASASNRKAVRASKASGRRTTSSACHTPAMLS